MCQVSFKPLICAVRYGLVNAHLQKKNMTVCTLSLQLSHIKAYSTLGLACRPDAPDEHSTMQHTARRDLACTIVRTHTASIM